MISGQRAWSGVLWALKHGDCGHSATAINARLQVPIGITLTGQCHQGYGNSVSERESASAPLPEQQSVDLINFFHRF